jgi:hypothetical protein
MEKHYMIDLAQALKEVLDSSTLLSGWAVGIGGATVAVIIGTSHNRPDRLLFRLPYLLFLPGWCCIGCSIYLGNRIVGAHLATRFNPALTNAISDQINTLYDFQRTFLLWSLVFFGIWLICYTFTWIFLKYLHEGSR